MPSTVEERQSNLDKQVTAAYEPVSVCGHREADESSQQYAWLSNPGTNTTDKETAHSELLLQERRVRLLSPKMQELHKKTLCKFLQTTIILCSFLICVLSIYWGTEYNESHFMHKVSVLVVIQDTPSQNRSSLAGIIPSITRDVPCTWHMYDSGEYQRKRNVQAAQINGEFLYQVHHQDYWMGLNVKPNATDDFIESLTNASAQSFNFSDYFQVVYESARSPSTMKTAILTNMQYLEQLYKQEVVTNYLPLLVSQEGDDVVRKNLIGASNIGFDYWDYRPFYNPVILSPLQVGLIYCLLLTFFQIGFYASLQREMAQLLKLRLLVFYRLGVSHATYFILSLFFCTLSAIFQIDFTKAFGRAGFVVYWMSTWLLMAALGGANENAVSIITLLGPQYVGLWLMSWIVLNISPAFYPLVTDSDFYRYGYMMPIPNAVEIFKVIFLDTSKRAIGRHYGVICAWIGLNTCLLPAVLFIVNKKTAKRDAVSNVNLEKSDQEG